MRLSSHDASFVYGETANGPMHGVSFTLLEGSASFEEIFAYYEHRVPLIPRLRQKLRFAPFNLAHPRWVDDPDFDLSNHLIRHELPPRTTLAQAEAIALKLAEAPLDRNRPLWRSFVLEGVEGNTLLAMLNHHAFVDGATAVALTTVLTDPTPDAQAPESDSDWNPAPEPTVLDQWLDTGAALVEQFRTAARRTSELPKLADQELLGALSSLAEPVMQAPWNRSAVGPKRKLANFTVSLDDIKQIRRAFGGTLNDVAVSLVAEGVTGWMADQGVPAKGQYLRLMCPVDVRGPDDNAIDMQGNKVSALFPKLDARPLGITLRLQRVSAELKTLKAAGQAEAIAALQSGMPELPPLAALPTQAIGTAFDPTRLAAQWPLPVGPLPTVPVPHLGFNMTVSNVPGPTWTQYVAGYRVINHYGTLMLGGNLGLGTTVNSYDGKLTFGFTADPRLMPDVEQLRDRVEALFHELLATATPRGEATQGKAPEAAQQPSAAASLQERAA